MYPFYLTAWILTGGIVAAFHINLLRSHVRPMVAYLTAIGAAIVAGGLTLKAVFTAAAGNTLALTVMVAAVVAIAMLLVQEVIAKQAKV